MFDEVVEQRYVHLVPDAVDFLLRPEGFDKQHIRTSLSVRDTAPQRIVETSDALAVTGLDDTLRRCVAYAEAGADVLFVEALRTQEEIDRVRHEVDVPLLYNFVEHGKSPLIPVSQLEALGFKMVIFPGSLMLSVCTMAQRI